MSYSLQDISNFQQYLKTFDKEEYLQEIIEKNKHIYKKYEQYLKELLARENITTNTNTGVRR